MVYICVSIIVYIGNPYIFVLSVISSCGSIQTVLKTFRHIT